MRRRLDPEFFGILKVRQVKSLHCGGLTWGKVPCVN